MQHNIFLRPGIQGIARGCYDTTPTPDGCYTELLDGFPATNCNCSTHDLCNADIPLLPTTTAPNSDPSSVSTATEPKSIECYSCSSVDDPPLPPYFPSCGEPFDPTGIPTCSGTYCYNASVAALGLLSTHYSPTSIIT